MSASGYTPILIYASGTTTNVPLAANMTSSASGAELAINYADGKLFYKDSSGVVQVLATKATALSTVTNNGVVYVNSSGQATSGSALTFDGTNLGLGVTPSAWGSQYKAIQSGNGGSAIGFQTNANVMRLFVNNFYNGTNNVYIGSAAASQYTCNSDGSFNWQIAASGTAGNAITFTQALTLSAAGVLSLGDTGTVASSFSGVKFNGASYNGLGLNDSSSTSGAGFIYFQSNGTTIGSITRVGATSAVAYNVSSDYRLKNITGPITTSGTYIDSLNPVEGTWKADGSIFVGLIAHEAQESSRTQVATGTKDGAEMQSMDYSNPELIANLIAEVKSLRQRVATLEAK